MNEDDVIQKLAKLVGDLGFDYDRMSQAGKATYDEICGLINKLSNE